MLFLALPARKIQGLNPKIDLLGRKVGLNYQNDRSFQLSESHKADRYSGTKKLKCSSACRRVIAMDSSCLS